MKKIPFAGTAGIVLAFALSAVPALTAQQKPKLKLSRDEAQTIALKTQAGTVKDGELEHEKGRWIYSFDIVDGGQTHEVNIDANTGAVVSNTVESAADEAREKAEDARKQKKS